MDTLPTSGAQAVRALHFQDGVEKSVEDHLVIEGALQISVKGAPFSVTMRTPGDDVSLAIGLLFTEGLIRNRVDILGWKETPGLEASATATVDLALSDPDLTGFSKRRLVSNASCGVCGIISADDLQTPSLSISTGRSERLDPTCLPALEGKMRLAQTLFSRTGGCHAAAIFDAGGELLVLKEDVGRHNAVDKAVGHLLLNDLMAKAVLLFISGRVSYEIVTKASKAGILFLAAVSAPSTLAVTMCRDAGITLMAFVRGGKATVYTHPERVIRPAETGHAITQGSGQA